MRIYATLLSRNDYYGIEYYCNQNMDLLCRVTDIGTLGLPQHKTGLLEIFTRPVANSVPVKVVKLQNQLCTLGKEYDFILHPYFQEVLFANWKRKKDVQTFHFRFSESTPLPSCLGVISPKLYLGLISPNYYFIKQRVVGGINGEIVTSAICADFLCDVFNWDEPVPELRLELFPQRVPGGSTFSYDHTKNIVYLSTKHATTTTYCPKVTQNFLEMWVSQENEVEDFWIRPVLT